MTSNCSRIFVVGCARSGTTLLQAMLSSHSEIISFPESQFFANVVDQYDVRVMGAGSSSRKKLLYLFQSVLLKLGLSPRPVSGVYAINRFIDKANIQSNHVKFWLNKYLLSSQISEMIRLMDQVASAENKKAWLLKTPSNISYIDIIQKYVEGAKFIHILRPGNDVVASIYDAALKYPDTVWKTHFYRNSLERIAGMWNESIKQTIRYVQQPNHIAVAYESLVDNPESELARLFEYIGIENDPTCHTKFSEQAANIVSGNEKWKGGVSGEMKVVNKYETLFDSRQKSILESILDDVDIKNIVS